MQKIKEKLDKIEIITDGVVELINKLSSILSDQFSYISPKIESELFYYLINNYKLSTGLAHDLTKILCNSTYQKYEFIITDNFKSGNELIIEKIKRNFGSNLKLSISNNIKTSIEKISNNDNTILCESINNNISNGWWIYLMDLNKEIFTKINNDFEENDTSHTFYGITKLSEKPNYDRSFIVAETSSPVSINWLKTILIKLKIPVYKIVESLATYKNNVIHLIEITGNINENDMRFGKEIKIGNTNFEILKKIGGYFQKINSIENNQLLFLK